MEDRQLEEKYPHAIVMKINFNSNGREIDSWCRQHVGGPYLITWTKIRFAREEDAVLFKLVWL